MLLSGRSRQDYARRLSCDQTKPRSKTPGWQPSELLLAQPTLAAKTVPSSSFLDRKPCGGSHPTNSFLSTYHPSCAPGFVQVHHWFKVQAKQGHRVLPNDAQQLNLKQQRLRAVVCQLPFGGKRRHLGLQHARHVADLWRHQHSPLAALPHAYECCLQPLYQLPCAQLQPDGPNRHIFGLEADTLNCACNNTPAAATAGAAAAAVVQGQ